MLTRRGNPIAFLAFCLFSTLAFAAGTRTWEQSQFEDLTKGTSDNVAVRSDGGLELAPAFKAVSTTPSADIWSIATDRMGNVYAAAGTPARVYLITPGGKSSVVFQSQELQVQAIAVDTNGAVYAATNPDGKVYRLTSSSVDGLKEKNAGTASWAANVYFDPGSKYIWDLALDKSGNLFVATGDKGEIFRVTPSGEHSVFFKSDEPHIRVLAFDDVGDLIAGSDGSGLIYRISPNGDGFVLYSAPKKEITALAVDAQGNIYAAGAGEKRATSPAAPSLSIPPPGSSSGSPGTNTSLIFGFPTVGGSSTTQSSGVVPASGAGSAGGSEIYRISRDGGPVRIWSSRDDLVYALAFDQTGALLAGTGNRGHIFRISGKDQFTDLLKASASQITAFAHTSGNRLYAAGSNLGKIFILDAQPAAEGTYLSDVFDAHIFSQWGRADVRGSGNIEMFGRSGNVDNPDRNWSSWKKIDWRNDATIHVPPARFVQWKAVLHTGNPPPRIDSVIVNYLSKNVAPDFDDVVVQDGVRYLPSAKSDGSGMGNNPVTPIHERGSTGIKWTVHDDNDDDMMYSVYYRGEGDTRWLLLKDNLTDKFYSFDSSLLPDGAYTIKVIASDAPSHSPGEALTAEKQSARFEIDTTPPQIQGLKAEVEGNRIQVLFSAVDSFSSIQHAECSLDAGYFQYVEPATKISDSRTEHYDFRIDLTAPIQQTEHVIVVRAYDRHDNMASAKIVVGK